MEPRPRKPILVFDGDCNFCRRWVRKWQQLTGDRVLFMPSRDPRVQNWFPDVPRFRFDYSVILFEPEGEPLEGAAAVFKTLSHARMRGIGYFLYRYLPGFSWISEMVYRWIASHRSLASGITRRLWGDDAESASAFALSSTWFLRLLGIIYASAFGSLFVQIRGLIGREGILPASDFLERVAAVYGPERFLRLPTIFWWNSGDGLLEGVCVAGILLSVLLLLGFFPVVILTLLWIAYLSLFSVGQAFLGFQWDILLLETGFLAIFLAPATWSLRVRRATPVSKGAHFLLVWLLFRLMFQSGLVKLLSGDSAWRSLTALTFHYETQPIPTTIAWYVHQLPALFQKMSTVAMFVMELVVPFFIFAPRRLRHGAAFLLGAFQVTLLLTGNYAFFNWLTLALCLLLLDDAGWPSRWRTEVFYLRAHEVAMRSPSVALRAFRSAIFGALFILSLIPLAGMFGKVIGDNLISSAYRAVAPFHVVNGYGLFAVMTTTRPEIVLEGSDDEVVWKTYEFKYKAGDLSRRPPFVAPHQPRLDWQMWFAALGDYRQSPWFLAFCRKILEGSADVTSLLASNPFPEHPPKYLRATLYEYRFTSREEKRATGRWWKRAAIGPFSPVLSLEPKNGK